MASDLTSYLLNDSRHADISPERLELMGKEAANLLLDKGVSLNESIVKIASAFDDITHEQVKRVCEFANTQVYLAKHDQNKTAGSKTSYPQFALADPNRVIQDLSDGARPTVITPTDVSYGQQPAKEKLSSAFVTHDFATEQLAELFKVSSHDNDFSRDTVVHDVTSTKEMLLGLQQNLNHSKDEFESINKIAHEDFYRLVKHHLLDGNSFADVLAAVHSSGASVPEVEKVAETVVNRLLAESVASASQLMEGVKGYTKVAGRVVNDEHPFVQRFKEVISTSRETEKCASALAEVHAGLEELETFIRETFLAGTAS